MKNTKALYQQIHDRLMEEMSAGAYRAGEYLPPLPKICAQFGAGAATARRALHMLEQEGYLLYGSNRRYIVHTPVGEEQFTEDYIRRQLSKRTAMADLYEAVAVLYPRLLIHGLRLCTAEQLAQLREICREMDAWRVPLSQIAERSLMIYRKAVEPLGNPLVTDLFTQVHIFLAIPHVWGCESLNWMESRYATTGLEWEERLRLAKEGRLDDVEKLLADSCWQRRDATDQFIREIAKSLPDRGSRRFSGKETAFDWRPGKKRSQLTEVTTDLVGRIMAGDCRKSVYLPSISEMAAEYGVARVTVRQAAERLERLGLTRFISPGKIAVVSREIKKDAAIAHPEIAQLLLTYLCVLQILADTVDVMVGIIPWTTAPREIDRWERDCLEAPFSSAQIIFGWIVEKIPNPTLQMIGQECYQRLSYGYCLARMMGEEEKRALRTIISEKIRQFAAQLRRQDWQGFGSGFARFYQLWFHIARERLASMEEMHHLTPLPR